jgi:hypothetical protein
MRPSAAVLLVTLSVLLALLFVRLLESTLRRAPRFETRVRRLRPRFPYIIQDADTDDVMTLSPCGRVKWLRKGHPLHQAWLLSTVWTWVPQGDTKKASLGTLRSLLGGWSESRSSPQVTRDDRLRLVLNLAPDTKGSDRPAFRIGVRSCGGRRVFLMRPGSELEESIHVVSSGCGPCPRTGVPFTLQERTLVLDPARPMCAVRGGESVTRLGMARDAKTGKELGELCCQDDGTDAFNSSVWFLGDEWLRDERGERARCCIRACGVL